MQATALSPDNKPKNRHGGLAYMGDGRSQVASFQGNMEHNDTWHNWFISAFILHSMIQLNCLEFGQTVTQSTITFCPCHNKTDRKSAKHQRQPVAHVANIHSLWDIPHLPGLSQQLVQMWTVK